MIQIEQSCDFRATPVADLSTMRVQTHWAFYVHFVYLSFDRTGMCALAHCATVPPTGGNILRRQCWVVLPSDNDHLLTVVWHHIFFSFKLPWTSLIIYAENTSHMISWQVCFRSYSNCSIISHKPWSEAGQIEGKFALCRHSFWPGWGLKITDTMGRQVSRAEIRSLSEPCIISRVKNLLWTGRGV